MSGFPIVIVSGLAYGIDACAHRAALNNNIITIAFPGSGLNEKILYPAGHRQLANQIVAAGGALLSEFKDDQKAFPWTFPVRNRLMAGIADVVIVIEAREKSGSLITAREAADYGRTVMVVPGPIHDERCTGSNQLLFDGATPVLNANTILHELGFSVDAIQSTLPLRTYTPDEQSIIDCLYEPQTRGELMQKLNMQMSLLNQKLTGLEIKGYIIETSGTIRIKA
jgi:DNA processing protein